MDAADNMKDPLSQAIFDASDNAPFLLDCGHAFTKASIGEIIANQSGECSICKKKLSESNRRIASIKGDLNVKLNPVSHKFHSHVEKNVEGVLKKFKAVEEIFNKQKDELKKSASEIITRMTEENTQLQEEEIALSISKLEERLTFFYCRGIYFETLFQKVATDLNNANEKDLVGRLSENETIDFYEKKLKNLSTQAEVAYKDLDTKQREIKDISTDYPDEELKKMLVNLKNLILDLLKLTLNKVKMNGINPTKKGTEKFEDLKNKLNQKNLAIIELQNKAPGSVDSEITKEKAEHDKHFGDIKKFIDDLDDDNKWLVNNLEKELKRILTLSNKFMSLVDPSKKTEAADLKKKLLELQQQVESEKKGMGGEPPKSLTAAASEKVKELESRLKEEQENVQRLEESLSSAERTVKEHSQKIEKLESENHTHKEEISQLQKTVSELTEERTELHKTVEEHKTKIQEKETHIEETTKSLHESRTENETLTKKVEEHEKHIEELKKHLETAHQEKETLTKRVEELTEESKTKSEKIEEIEKQLAESRAENEKHVTKIQEHEKTIEELTKKLETVHQEKEELIKNVEHLNKEVQHRDEQIKTLNEDISNLRDQLNALTQENARIKGYMQERNEHVQALFDKFKSHQF